MANASPGGARRQRQIWNGYYQSQTPVPRGRRPQDTEIRTPLIGVDRRLKELGRESLGLRFLARSLLGLHAGKGHRLVETIITKARTEAGPIRFGLAWASSRALTPTQVERDVLHIGRDGSQKAPAAGQPIQFGVDVPSAIALSAAPWPDPAG